MFSGSYKKEDVIFLLKKIEMISTEVVEKEKNIQSGQSHYSEMITYEKEPKKEYMNLFYETINENGDKFIRNMHSFAKKVINDYQNEKEITIVSLARAGTPVGVILKRILENIQVKKVNHYCVSIIRDKGIDKNAINFILEYHKDTTILFVDGWTGKGVIGKELKSSINEINLEKKINISSKLYVVADISGTAYWSATNEDYLLPSAILNSTVSGLVSRTILNNKYISEKDFHGCIYYENLVEFDVSNWFIDKMMDLFSEIDKEYHVNSEINKEEDRVKSEETIKFFTNKYNLKNINFIKPGIGESTRVLLRRVPKEIWIRDEKSKFVKHLIYLAKEKGVNVIFNKEMLYNSVCLIEEMD